MTKERNTKRWVLLSIGANVILLFLYLNYYHHKKAFDGHEEIQQSLEINNESFSVATEELIRGASKQLRKKPKLSLSVMPLFDKNKMLVDGFESKVDSLMSQKHIRTEDVSNIQKEYVGLKDQFVEIHEKQLYASQKEAKLTNREVDNKIAGFGRSVVEDAMQYDSLDLKNMSEQEKRLTLIAMLNDIQIVQHISNNDFAGLLGFSGSRLYKDFPILLSYLPEVKKGTMLDLEIGIGAYGSDWYLMKETSKVYLDGEEIKMNAEGRTKISIPTTSRGKKEHEGVIHWRNPYTEEMEVDTILFFYEVI